MQQATDGSRESTADEEMAAQLSELVRRLSRRLRQGSARRLELFGLSDGQARVLRLVARSGSPPRMSDIAHRIEVVPRSATTVVACLETKGLVIREIDLEDRRSVLVRLTDAGRKLVAEMGRDRDAVALELFGRLPRADRAVLLERLARLVPADADPTESAGDAAAASLLASPAP
jgi:DNA-binding MarR family transcriptional regulator